MLHHEYEQPAEKSSQLQTQNSERKLGKPRSKSKVEGGILTALESI
jgi:hypothetical protein